MLKLIKYDWKRNSFLFYATTLILILLNALFQIGLLFWNWDPYVVITFTVIGFIAAGITLFVRNCTMFADNLKSYSRRLLPVTPYQEMGSIAIIHTIYVVILGVLMGLSILFFPVNIKSLGLEKFNFEIESYFFAFLTIIYWIFSSVGSLVYIFFAISTALMLRSKFRAWVGIAAFIALTTVLSTISNLILGKASDMGIKAGSGDYEMYLVFPTQYLGRFSLNFLFEIITAALVVFITARIMERKVEL